MPKYLIVGPEYGTVEPILDDGTGPMEYQSDVLEVEALSKPDAKVLGIKLLRKIRRGHLDRCRDENPFAGVKVIELGVDDDI